MLPIGCFFTCALMSVTSRQTYVVRFRHLMHPGYIHLKRIIYSRMYLHLHPLLRKARGMMLDASGRILVLFCDVRTFGLFREFSVRVCISQTRAGNGWPSRGISLPLHRYDNLIADFGVGYVVEYVSIAHLTFLMWQRLQSRRRHPASPSGTCTVLVYEYSVPARYSYEYGTVLYSALYLYSYCNRIFFKHYPGIVTKTVVTYK